MKVRFFFEKEFVRTKKCLERLNVSSLERHFTSLSYNVNIYFLSKKTIEYLNNKLFGRKGPTDVISLDLGEIGELYISPYQVLVNARRYHQAFCRELLRVIIHGLLHLSGYKHSRRMFAIQEELLDNFYR